MSGRLSSIASLYKLGNQSQKLATRYRECRQRAGFKRAMLIGSGIHRVPEPGTALPPAGSPRYSPSSPVVTYFSQVWKRRSNQATLKTEWFQEPYWEVQKYLPAHRQLSGQVFSNQVILLPTVSWHGCLGQRMWRAKQVRTNTRAIVSMLVTFLLLICLTL